MLQDTLVLVKPTEQYGHDAKKYKEECLELDGTIYGDGGLGQYEEYSKWLEALKKREGTERKDGVPSEVYFAMQEEDDKILGTVEIHKYLAQVQKAETGNIEICIRPCYRGEGYGKKVLELALQQCRELAMDQVVLICNEDNLRFANLVLACGGREDKSEVVPEEVRKFVLSLD